ncbi:hypothetical protein LUZ60_017672 [Juncus effusus]|nr:hypothetical protein LUZ60_017672 [Juncus effusus]
MSRDICVERPLFGGAISSYFPTRFQDVSGIREVPDHQEVVEDPSRDESLIFELLDLKDDVADSESATWFLRDLASEQDSAENMLLENSGAMQLAGLNYGGARAIAKTAIAKMAISKGRQGREAQNLVRVYLANIRLRNVSTDVLISAYEPLLINPLSESARTVGPGLAVPAQQSGLLPVSEIFRLALTSFKVNDWNLFSVGTGN